MAETVIVEGEDQGDAVAATAGAAGAAAGAAAATVAAQAASEANEADQKAEGAMATADMAAGAAFDAQAEIGQVREEMAAGFAAIGDRVGAAVADALAVHQPAPVEPEHAPAPEPSEPETPPADPDSSSGDKGDETPPAASSEKPKYSGYGSRAIFGRRG